MIGVDGDPISGLYVAGNAMGSPFGMTYGGPGGTIGPAMVFGYLAARHATACPSDAPSRSERRSGTGHRRRGDSDHRRHAAKRDDPPSMLRP